MATVAEARRVLKNMIRYGNASYDDVDYEYALRYALERTFAVSGLVRTIGTFSVAANDLTITHGLTRFLPGRMFAAAYTGSSDGYRRLTARDLTDIQAMLDQSTSTGRPEMIAFINTTQCMIYPIADAAYTINVPYEQTAPTWTFGNGDSTDLALPDSLIYGGMLWGAKHFLLSGADESKGEASRAKEEFEQFLMEREHADIHLAPTIEPRGASDDQTHTPSAGW